MPLIELEGYILLFWITLGCFVFQLSGAMIGLAIPDSWYAKDRKIFRLKPFEKSGEFYERVFHIKAWKKYLPDGGVYKKRHLSDFTKQNLTQYIIESKRAELSHILGFIPFVFFVLFTPWYVWIIVFFYDILVNVPCYMAQRYNRPRVENLLKVMESRKDTSKEN